MRKILPLATAVAAALAGPTSAQAGGPGQWTRVTPVDHALKNITEIAVDRAANGGLHLAWQFDKSVFHDLLGPDLKTLAGLHTVVTYRNAVNNELDIEALGGTVFAYYAGLEPDTPHDGVLAMSQSTDGGATWTPPAAVSHNSASAHSPVYAANGIAAAHGLDGTLYSLWASPGSAFHIGASPADPDTPLPGGSSVDAGIGVDAKTGQVVAGWNLLDEDGTAVMQLNPPGARTVIPGSGAAQLQSPVSVVGRVGQPGVYAGYSAGDNQFLAKPAVFRFGATKGTILSSTEGARDTKLAHTASGRLWALWHRSGKIYARRSNKAATKWGPLQSIKPPAGTSTIWGLAAEGLAEPLDVVARIGRGEDIGGWHQRILPRLRLKTKVSGRQVTVTVLDVGDPVAGATVKLTGEGSKKTGPTGKASFTTGAGRHKATATAPYGGKGSKKLRVRR
jgi:hypothetical protein